jgi:hypothetical protein
MKISNNMHMQILQELQAAQLQNILAFNKCNPNIQDS